MITGQLGMFFETGTEGVMWVVEEAGKQGYDALNYLDAGDQLRILTPEGALVWEGTITPDFKTGYQPYPLNPTLGQPSALGYWIHWTQEGFEPDVWASFFIRQSPRDPQYLGELTKAPKYVRPKICAACNHLIDEGDPFMKDGFAFHPDCWARGGQK